MKLTNRLKAVAKFAEDGKCVADIGTDHAYIPVYLAKKGSARRIVASDIVEGPLSRARASAKEYGVEEKIEFILADGLCGMQDCFDTIIIAGMGGDTIISILKAAPWTKENVKLVLQPQSKIERLSKWLYHSGYHIEDASLAADAGKLYMVMSVRGGQGTVPVCEAEHFVNRKLFEKQDPLLEHYLNVLERKFSRAAEGIKESGESLSDRFSDIFTILDDIRKMKGEVSA